MESTMGKGIDHIKEALDRVIEWLLDRVPKVPIPAPVPVPVNPDRKKRLTPRK